MFKFAVHCMRILADHELKNEQCEGLSQFHAVGKVRVWVVVILCYWASKWYITQHGQMCRFGGHVTLNETFRTSFIHGETLGRKNIESYVSSWTFF